MAAPGSNQVPPTSQPQLTSTTTVPPSLPRVPQYGPPVMGKATIPFNIPALVIQVGFDHESVVPPEPASVNAAFAGPHVPRSVLTGLYDHAVHEDSRFANEPHVGPKVGKLLHGHAASNPISPYGLQELLNVNKPAVQKKKAKKPLNPTAQPSVDPVVPPPPVVDPPPVANLPPGPNVPPAADQRFRTITEERQVPITDESDSSPDVSPQPPVVPVVTPPTPVADIPPPAAMQPSDVPEAVAEPPSQPPLETLPITAPEEAQ